MFKSQPVISQAKLGAMLADLRDLRGRLLPDEELQAREQEMAKFDDFQKEKFQLNLILKDIRSDCDKLDELRRLQDQTGVKQRSPETIRLQNQNTRRLKEARDSWQKLNSLLVKDAKSRRSGLDAEELQSRRRTLEQLGTEMQMLARKNATVKGGSLASGLGSSGGGADAESRRQQRVAARREAREARRKQRAGGDDFEDQLDEQAHPVTVQEQQFYEQVEGNLEEQDELLDEILQGMTELKELGEDMNKHLKLQSEKLEEVDAKMDETIAEFKTANTGLQELLDKSGGVSRWCPMIMCLILLLALVGYMINIT